MTYNWILLGLLRHGTICAALCFISALSVPATAQDTPETAPEESLRPEPRPEFDLPPLHWDEERSGMAGPAGADWGIALMSSLRADEELLSVVPEDIAAWCPAYPDATLNDRAAFWAGLISALSWHESTHREGAIGGGGRWFGLIQISPATARYRECGVGTGAELLDGAANLRCGALILSQNVRRDGVISAGMRGVAAEWGPFHTRRKREEMQDWVSSQPYCVSSG